MTEYMRSYRATPNGKKRTVIADWKFHGLIGDYDSIYDRYINTTHCDKCKVLLTSEKIGGNQKHMDHCHQTGHFRFVLCARCNTKQHDRTKNKNNTSGHKGIVFNKKKKLWQYRKQINKKTYSKRSKCKITLLTYKFCFLLLMNRK